MEQSTTKTGPPTQESVNAVAGLDGQTAHDTPSGSSVFHRGIFAPVETEISAKDLRVSGTLPDDLDGMFVRNGPNPLLTPGRNYHWFDGDGMVHAVRIRDGRADYVNRFVKTESLERQRRTGIYHGLSINDGPRGIIRNVIQGIRTGGFDYGNKANTSVIWHHGKLLALWELGAPYELRPSDLGTVGPKALAAEVRHGVTAHPKIDPATGELLYFGYSVLRTGIEYGVLDSSGKLVHSTNIPLRRRIMMHDFAITKRYAVFMDLPMVARSRHAVFGKPIYQYRPELVARFGVMPRRGSGNDVQWFEVDPCFVFHVLNAWENGSKIEVLGCRFASGPAVLKSRRLTEADLDLDAVLYRWELDVASGEVREGPIDEIPAEFPRLDDSLLGTKNRYGYATSFSIETAKFVMYDLEKGISTCHPLGPGRTAGEGVFVPRRTRLAENDGYLMAFVHDQREDRSEFLILDCQQFDRPPIATIHLPQRVPVGFHGVWIDSTDL